MGFVGLEELDLGVLGTGNPVLEVEDDMGLPSPVVVMTCDLVDQLCFYRVLPCGPVCFGAVRASPEQRWCVRLYLGS